jgi:hypothetical protein
MFTGSDSINASTIFLNVGRIRLNEPGKLIPSARGHDNQVAECDSHSAGMPYPSSRGVLVDWGLVMERQSSAGGILRPAPVQLRFIANLSASNLISAVLTNFAVLFSFPA